MTGDDLEHAGREVGRQRSGHLVEQQHVRLDGEGAGQVDDPKRGEGQVPCRDAQVEGGNAEVGNALSEGLDGGLGQHEVLGDREVGDDRRLLVHRDHAGAPGLGG